MIEPCIVLIIAKNYSFFNLTNAFANKFACFETFCTGEMYSSHLFHGNSLFPALMK